MNLPMPVHGGATRPGRAMAGSVETSSPARRFRLSGAKVALVMSATMALMSAVHADAPAADSHPPQRVPASVADWARGARLFEGLGDFHRAVTSSSALAQQYFDQGMRLLWAFNHDESTRSFARAAELDPACAACYWGVALTVGPNYNLPAMDEMRARVAWEALQRAQENAAHASAVEQALISALATRYPAPSPPAPDSELPPWSLALVGFRRDRTRSPAPRCHRSTPTLEGCRGTRSCQREFPTDRFSAAA